MDNTDQSHYFTNTLALLKGTSGRLKFTRKTINHEDVDDHGGLYPTYCLHLEYNRHSMGVRFQQWPGLCATVLMFWLHGTCPKDEELIAALKEDLIHYFHGINSYHNIAFATSVEECDGSRKEFIKALGFEKHREHISTRTHHMIEHYSLDLASKEASEAAIDYRNKYLVQQSVYA